MQVIAWPSKVGVVAAEWSYVQGTSRSRSLLTRRAYISQADPERRVVSLSVSGRQNGGIGAGYMEVLKRRLQGGANAVRLWSWPVNWHLRQLPVGAADGGSVLSWVAGTLPLAWQQVGGAPLYWSQGESWVAVKPAGTERRLDVSALPPGVMVAGPGDFVALTHPVTQARMILMVAREAWTSGSGDVDLHFVEPVPHGGIVQFGVRDSGVFLAEGLPRAVQPARGDWTYDWSFEEVFADEVGGFQESDPW